MQRLKEQNFHCIASRQIYVSDPRDASLFRTRILKSDLKLWKESPFEIVDTTELSRRELGELLKLYNLLYITQHTELQPQINLDFMELLLQKKVLQFKIVKLDGIIKGAAGYIERNGLLFCPFFGYDKEDEQHSTLYRTLSTALLLEAQKRNVRFHQSAGASFYKTIRRAQSSLEFMAVYTEHLPYRQKWIWKTLQRLVNRVAPTYMKKY
jgi:hypothetical protein